MKYKIEIPHIYLLQLASAGHMGTGKMLDTCRIWARRECVRLGLEPEMNEAIKDNVDLLKKSIRQLGVELKIKQ